MSKSIVHWVEQRSLVLLAVILILAGAVRVYAFRGYSGLDDAEYARFAYLLANGIPFPADYTGPAVFPLRIGLIAPTAFFYQIFGVNESTMVLYPLVMSLAGIALVYWSASLFFGSGAGVIAAALLAFYFWDIDSATRLLPDQPAAFLATLGTTVIVAAVYRWRSTPRRLLLAGLAAGVIFGASWLTKETIAYLVPFCGLLLVMTAVRLGRAAVPLWLGVALGSIAALASEATVYSVIAGDPLFRLHEMERNYRQWPNGFFTEGSDFGWTAGSDYRTALINRLFISGPSRILLDRSLYGLPLVALVAAAIGWARRRREFLIPGLWLLSLVLMFNFGSSSTQSYVPLALYHRYLYLAFFPAVVLVAGFLWYAVAAASRQTAAAGDWLERAAVAAAVAGMAWAAVPILYFDVAVRANWWNAEVKALDERVASDTPVYADPLSLRAFEFFERYPTHTSWVDFADIASPREMAPGSLVIVNSAYLEWLDRNAGMWVDWPRPGATDTSGYRQHSFYETPPSDWRLVLRTQNARVYRVEPERQAALP